MKLKFALSVAAIVLVIVSACNKTEEPATEAPPPAAVPAASDSAASGYEVIQVADGGSVSGTITVSGTIPKLPARTLNKDPKVCGTGTRPSEQLMVSKTGALRNAVVIIEGVKRGKAMPVTTESSQIDQSKCEYIPHVQVVPVNTEIAVVNSDPVLHNIHFYQNDESLFNIAQPVQGQVTKKKLEKTGFVYAECDVHGWMQGHVAVVDNPYYAVTDENGKFSIADLPAGTYQVKVWHEYLGERSQEITIASKTDAALNLDLKDLLAQKTPVPITSVAPAGAAGASAPASAAGSATANEVVVQMHSEATSYRFEPANITVKAGTTVKWVNMSTNRHTATDDPETEKLAGQAILPAGVMPWDSPFLAEGQSFTKTFTVPGKYQYFCRNHGQFGMVATITVTP
jgi:plastocyanin